MALAYVPMERGFSELIMEQAMYKRIFNTFVALAVVIAAIGCQDAQETQHAQQRSLLNSQLQQVDTLRTLAARSAEARRQELESIDSEVRAIRSQIAGYEQAVQAYMLDHKMAVAAIVAGAAGSTAVLNENGRFTEDARQVGALVGGAAAIWALFNLDEAIQVASELAKAEVKLTSMNRQRTALERHVFAASVAFEDAQRTLGQLTQQSDGVRTALAAL